MSDLAELMTTARRARRRMEKREVEIGLVASDSPLSVHLAIAMGAVQHGLRVKSRLDVAVGFLMLGEVMERLRARAQEAPWAEN